MIMPQPKSAPDATSRSGEREVQYEHSTDFVPFLSHLNASLLVSTYQAGKLIVVSSTDNRISFGFHNFMQPMGMAASKDRIAVGSDNKI